MRVDRTFSGELMRSGLMTANDCGFKLGGGIRSQPVAYQLDGESYVAIASGNFTGIAGAVGGDTQIPEGGHLFVFKLDEDD
ncbi:MAG: hypothetical protein ACI80L_002627 [Pseudohongiellaceae bacterium]|jgi:hypothetical protein